MLETIFSILAEDDGAVTLVRQTDTSILIREIVTPLLAFLSTVITAYIGFKMAQLRTMVTPIKETVVMIEKLVNSQSLAKDKIIADMMEERAAKSGTDIDAQNAKLVREAYNLRAEQMAAEVVRSTSKNVIVDLKVKNE